MGYTTDFYGDLEIYPDPEQNLVIYINQFSSTRRMKRNLPARFGIDGEYFCQNTRNWGQDKDSTIIEYNDEPSTQHSLWCKWIIENNKLKWDGGENFYSYTEWLCYLINNFFDPNEYKLNGKITWQGEEDDDIGTLSVKENVVYEIFGSTEVDMNFDNEILNAYLALQNIESFKIYEPKPIKEKLNFKNLLEDVYDYK